MEQPADEKARDMAEKVVVLDELPQDGPLTATESAPEPEPEPVPEPELVPEPEPIDVKSFM